MQWFDAGTFVISLIGLYYKREEFNAVFSKMTAALELAQQPALDRVNCNSVAEQQPAPATPPPQPKKASIIWIEHLPINFI